MGKIKLSVIVIAKNEEEMLGDCLKSLAWADERVVIDNGSTDKTVEVAKKHKAVIAPFAKQASKGSFAEVRNFAALKAKGEWILYVDADERSTPELEKEILSVVGNETSLVNAYAIPRKNILLGQEMKYGGWSPDYVLRLIKKSALDGWEGQVHEQPKIKGEVGKLKNRLIHITHRNLSDMLNKTNDWSEIEAKLLFNSDHPKMNIWRFFTAGFREFWYRAIKKVGFMDGTVGWIEIMYQTYSRLITYTKLWELQIKAEAKR